jgi:hypothetical protein
MEEMNEADIAEKLAYELVGQLAPQEKPLFNAYAAADRASGGKGVRAKAGKNEMLGFAGEHVAAEIVYIFSPLLVCIARDVVAIAVEHMRELAKKKGVNDSKGAVVGYLARLLLRKPVGREEVVIQLQKEHLEKIRQVARDRALADGFPQDKAEMVADAIVGKLAEAT